MPVATLLDPVEVFEELPYQPRFPGAGLADDRDVAGPAFVRAVVGRVDDRPEFAFTADERRFEAGTAAGPSGAGHDPQCDPCVDRPLASLDLMDAAVLVGDRGLGGTPRDVVDEHAPGGGDRLKPGCGIDRVTQHHPLAL